MTSESRIKTIYNYVKNEVSRESGRSRVKSLGSLVGKGLKGVVVDNQVLK